MLPRGALLLFVVAVLTVALLASVTAAGSGRPVGVVQVRAPSSAEGVVAYDSSRLLLFEPSFPGPPGVTRIGLDGSADRSFGDEGRVEISAEGVAVTPKGKILIATASDPSESAVSSDARVTRLLPDGRRDPSFGVGGSADVHFGGRYGYGEAVAVAADGDILLGGLRVVSAVNRGESDYSLAVARLESDGSLDRSFGKNGIAVLPGGGEIGVFDVAPTASGGVVVAGGNELQASVWKLSRDGSLDRRFGDRGLAEMPSSRKANGRSEELFFASGIALAPSGKLLLAATGFIGGRFRVVVTRLRPDGRVDRSYSDDGWAAVAKSPHWTLANGLTLLPGGVLAVAAAFDAKGKEHREFGAIAFGPDGRLEQRFGKHGRCRARLPGKREPVGVVNADGRVSVVGDGAFGLRLLHCPPLRRR